MKQNIYSHQITIYIQQIQFIFHTKSIKVFMIQNKQGVFK